MSRERHLEISRKGGLASGEARKRIANMRILYKELMLIEVMKNKIADEFAEEILILQAKLKRERTASKQREKRKK